LLYISSDFTCFLAVGIGWIRCYTLISLFSQDLCRHNFGHHVVQSVLEHGHEKHRKVVANILKADLLSFAKHRNASYLVEKALSYCAVEAGPGMARSTLGVPRSCCIAHWGCRSKKNGQLLDRIISNYPETFQF
jgi:hypothetical protein